MAITAPLPGTLKASPAPPLLVNVTVGVADVLFVKLLSASEVKKPFLAINFLSLAIMLLPLVYLTVVSFPCFVPLTL